MKKSERLLRMKPELLAPANLKTLSAAVQAGADAVYLGGSRFGARKFADNFDLEQLGEAVDYCHLRGVKVYLTVNILVDDSEKSEFIKFVNAAYNLGVDAFIIQDVGMAMLIKKHLPEAKIHASTQMTVHNTSGAELMKSIGFERVVTARELSNADVSDIVKKSGAEIEIFVHGALCMSYSGQCLMSSLIGGRSGNRGSCAQPCRLPYGLFCNGKKGQSGYFLSPRDLSLATHMTEVLQSGVASLKIEGRMKGPEYVAAAVSVFRKLIDENRNASPDEIYMLANAFSRNGFTGGAFAGEFKNYINFSSGNDDIYKNRDEVLLKNLKVYTDSAANIKRIPIEFKATAVCGKPFELEATAMGICVSDAGCVAEKAINKATDEQTLEKQLNKTGDYPFTAVKTEIVTDGQSFLPLGEINSLRRKCLDRLSEEIVSSYKKNTQAPLCDEKKKSGTNSKLEIAVMVSNEMQYEAAKQMGVECVYAPCEIAGAGDVAVFPDIIHNRFVSKYREILQNTECDKVCTANYAIIKEALKLGKKIISSPALNVFNSDSVEFWRNFGLDEIILSCELNLKQIGKVSSLLPLGAVIYGRLPMMKTIVCPVKSAAGKCGGKDCKAYLKDRKNEEFPVVCNGMTTFVLNSKPVYMADKLSEIEKAGISVGILQFTVESAQECREVIKAYRLGNASDGEFTRGHFYRGVT